MAVSFPEPKKGRGRGLGKKTTASSGRISRSTKTAKKSITPRGYALNRVRGRMR